jgi:hypothetical protein
MRGKLAAEIEATPEVLNPVRWRRAFEEMTDRRRLRQKTNSRLMAYVALTAASAPCFSDCSAPGL